MTAKALGGPRQLEVERARLEARLERPEAGENGFEPGREEMGRLEALRRLKALADAGEIPLAAGGRRGGINTHVHTAKSFSCFSSPAAAAWRAFLAGVGILGINDHYTTAGHEEFGAACRLLGIRPLFSMEAVAMWEEAERRGLTVNDPTNPGRTYLTAKGITRFFAPGSPGERDLRRMNAALLERNREITRRLAALCRERLDLEGAFVFEDVLALTPHGQPTERHITRAAASFLERRFAEREGLRAALSRLSGEEADPALLGDRAALEDFLRSRLIKAGRPAYVEESREAFIPLERLVSLGLELGAIPTYPVLGNPVTPWEADIEALLDRLEAQRIFAIEVIPDRNTAERLREIVEKAAARGLPVLSGTEHNTAEMRPLVDRFFFTPELRPHFERGAKVVLGHQALRRRGLEGYVREDGRLPPGERERHLERLVEASEDELES
jgi:hypothetical protein